MNMFEYAARNKLRFPSIKGLLALEDLFGLPLKSKEGFDLDNVAKAVNNQLKVTAEESFVDVPNGSVQTKLETMLNLVKFVIADKVAAAAAAQNAQARAAERQVLLQIKEAKTLDALKGLSAEEIDKRLGELG